VIQTGPQVNGNALPQRSCGESWKSFFASMASTEGSVLPRQEPKVCYPKGPQVIAKTACLIIFGGFRPTECQRIGRLWHHADDLRDKR
jgi:hypothetical protein